MFCILVPSYGTVYLVLERLVHNQRGKTVVSLFSEVTSGLGKVQRAGLHITEHENGHVTLWHVFTGTRFTVQRTAAGTVTVVTEQDRAGMKTVRAVPRGCDHVMYLQGHIYAVTDTIKATGFVPDHTEVVIPGVNG